MTHAEHAEKLYDAVGELWLRAYGEHVHIGLYDDRKARDRPSWGAAQENMVQQLLALSGLTSARRLLDVGCGHGATACQMAEALNCEAVGINISAFQVEHANRFAASRGLSGRAKFLVADGMAPPFEDGSFDVVVSVESAAYMPDKKVFIEQLTRLLAPGGTLILADFCRRPGEPTKKQWKALAGIDKAFASAGNWHSAEQYEALMQANGLEVKATADWTTRLRGFWDLSAAELLLRREPEMAARAQARSALANGLELSKQMMDLSKIVHVAFWSGCFEPFNMCVEGFVFGKNKRVMRHAFGSGALQYRVLVARKPASGAPSKVACPLVFDISAAAASGSGSGSGSGSTSDSGSASGSRPSDASDASAKRESEISSA